jgi:hypothetical protein
MTDLSGSFLHRRIRYNSLRIQFLGQPSIRFNDTPVNIPEGRPLALLAYLLVTKKSHRREHLIDLLFAGPDDPRAALRWTLTKIRKAIGSEYILSYRGEISFNFENDFWLDVSAIAGGGGAQIQADIQAFAGKEVSINADAFRFNGSDLMPEEVGMDSFFRGIHAWVEGFDLEMVLQQIDDSWPP